MVEYVRAITYFKSTMSACGAWARNKWRAYFDNVHNKCVSSSHAAFVSQAQQRPRHHRSCHNVPQWPRKCRRWSPPMAWSRRRQTSITMASLPVPKINFFCALSVSWRAITIWRKFWKIFGNRSVGSVRVTLVDIDRWRKQIRIEIRSWHLPDIRMTETFLPFLSLLGIFSFLSLVFSRFSLLLLLLRRRRRLLRHSSVRSPLWPLSSPHPSSFSSTSRLERLYIEYNHDRLPDSASSQDGVRDR